MADLASTRVFGKLTVMHEAIVKANAEIVGDITASKFIGDGSQLTALPWGQLTGAPATATRWPAWGEVTGKPSTFAPSAHTHSLAQITDAGNLAAINTNASTSNFLRGDGTWATPPNTNTTYSEITTAEIDAGTASTLRTITGRRMKYALDKKVDTTTQVIAGTGLSGGGTLASDRTLSVNYGTAAGTAAQGNDSRLSNSREWTATTVSQAEAEAGTATTRRAWTAQRVAQAISALGLKIGTTATTAKAGNWTPTAAEIPNLPASKITSGTFAAARIPTLNQNTTGNAATATRLQTARTINLGGSLDGSASFNGSGDITINSGIARATLTGDPSSTFRADIFGSTQYGIRLIRGIADSGPFANYSPGLAWSTSDTHAYLTLNYNNASVKVGAGSGTGINWSKELVFDDDTRIVNATPNTRTITAGTGLSGGGNLSANRTLSVNYGTTAGTAAQGNDSRLSNSREWTASTVTQAEAEAGTATTRRAWTAQRVRQAIAAYAAPSTRQIIAGTGLSGGGTLAANRTLSVNFATTAQAQALTADNVAITPKTLGDVLEDGILTGAGAPIGSVRWEMSRSNIGAGYSPCDGQLLSRATYPDAWAVIAAGNVPVISDAEWLADPTKRGAFSSGNGSSTFRLPDYNGKSAGTLGAVFQRGDGELSAGQAGVIQRDAIQSHTHGYDKGSWSSNTASGSSNRMTTAFATETSGPTAPARVADETRPLNVTGVWVVKLFGAVVNVGSADAAQLASDYASLSAAQQNDTGFTIIYPNGGSEASPANVTIRSRYIEDNPFPGHNVFCVPEVLYNGEWAWPGWYGANLSSSTGISAGQINSNQIIIQTGYSYFIYGNVASGGLHSNTGHVASTTALPCRVKVWKVKGATT